MIHMHNHPFAPKLDQGRVLQLWKKVQKQHRKLLELLQLEDTDRYLVHR